MSRRPDGISRRSVLGLGAAAVVSTALPAQAMPTGALPGAVAQRIRLDTVIEAICLNFGVSREVLLSADRSRYVVKARQHGMYLACEMTTRTLPEIGRRFGGRDHTTVLHAARKIRALMQADALVNEDIAYVRDCVLHMQAIKRGAVFVAPNPWRGLYAHLRP